MNQAMNKTPAISTATALAAAAFTFASGSDRSDILLSRPDFAQYHPLLLNSPFAAATAVSSVTSPRDIYVSTTVCSSDGEVVVIRSVSDKSFQESIVNGGPNQHGYRIESLEWSKKPAESKHEKTNQ